MRGGAEVARWAHNPKAVGSNPAPATKITFYLISLTYQSPVFTGLLLF
jgi:hypothetical protein